MNLTLKQKLFYDYIFRYYREYGFIPSYSTIQSYFGLKSPNSVTQHFKSLIRKEWLRADDEGLHFMVITNESKPLPEGDLSLKECIEILKKSPSPDACKIVAQRIDYLTRWHPLNEPIPKGELYQTHCDENGEFWRFYSKP